MYPRTGYTETRALHEIKTHESYTKHTHKPHSPLILHDVLSLTTHEINEINEMSCLQKDGQTKNNMAK